MGDEVLRRELTYYALVGALEYLTEAYRSGLVEPDSYAEAVAQILAAMGVIPPNRELEPEKAEELASATVFAYKHSSEEPYLSILDARDVVEALWDAYNGEKP